MESNWNGASENFSSKELERFKGGTVMFLHSFIFYSKAFLLPSPYIEGSSFRKIYGYGRLVLQCIRYWAKRTGTLNEYGV